MYVDHIHQQPLKSTGRTYTLGMLSLVELSMYSTTYISIKFPDDTDAICSGSILTTPGKEWKLVLKAKQAFIICYAENGWLSKACLLCFKSVRIQR